jgi:hypothetical protein
MKMSKEQYAPFLAAMKKLAEAQELLSRGPASFYVEQMVGAYDYLMDRFAPFKVGDKVVMVKELQTIPSGWSHCQHFLVPGARAVVEQIACDGKGFRVDVSFLDESWINRDGEKIPMEPDRFHTFSFNETYFVKVQ